LLVAVVAGFAVLVAGLAPATPAYANPPNPQQVEAQINQLWSQLEPVIDKFNGLQDQLTQNLAKQATLNQQLQPLQMRVDLAMTRVGAISSSLYEHGPGTNVATLLSADSPDAFLDELGTMNQLARQQQQAISLTNSQLAEYTRQKVPLDALVAQQKQQTADLAGQKQQIQAKIDELQKLRIQAYGTAGAAAGASYKQVPCPQTYIGGSAGKAVAYVCSKIGNMYAYGAAGPIYFDCSGLMLAAWGTAGVSLAHYTVSQRQQTTPISAGMLRPGDLIFYGSSSYPYHVAMYIGNGIMVHAPQPGERIHAAPINEPGQPSGYGRPRG
jgi:cell wall-associated NlpC family hydrolase